MRLVINNPENLDLNFFCDYLIDYLRGVHFNISDLDAKLIEQWNEYLKILFPDVQVTVEHLIQLFFDNQIYYKEKNNYVITVDRAIKIEDVPIERIAQTIQDGALGIPGFDIFEQSYEAIGAQIATLYVEALEANQ